MVEIPAGLGNVAVGIITGLITAAVSVRFALRRFRGERLWDRKLAAYTEVFDSLYHVQRYTRMELSRWEEGTEVSENHRNELRSQANLGYEAIRKAAIKGTFIVGKNAANRLNELVQAFDDPHYNEDIVEQLEADLKATTTAIEDLRRLAVADLKRYD